MTVYKTVFLDEMLLKKKVFHELYLAAKLLTRKLISYQFGINSRWML